MSARTGFTPRPESQAFEVGDIVGKRLGLHCNEPNVRFVVTKVNHSTVSIRGVTHGRGSKNRSRTFTHRLEQAASTLVVITRNGCGRRS
jgi:hypothetical protein